MLGAWFAQEAMAMLGVGPNAPGSRGKEMLFTGTDGAGQIGAGGLQERSVFWFWVFFLLNFREREHKRGERGRGRERILTRLHAQHGA